METRIGQRPEKSHTYELVWEKDGRTVIECRECGFKHLYPIPSSDEIESFYKSRYFEEIKPFDYESVTPEKVEETIRTLPNNERYRSIFEKVSELLAKSGQGDSDHAARRHMIDIGCGNQLLSKYFSLCGWEGHALELSSNACQFLRMHEVDVHQGVADEVDVFPITNVSFVNAQFVMEHMRDPSRFLTAAHRSMHQGGLIRIQVPNDFSAGQMAYREYFKESYHWVYYPDHINYFSFDSLSTLLSRHGFQEIYRTTNFPLEFLLLGGINYYRDEQFQRQVGPFVRNFEQSFIQTSRRQDLERLYEKLAEIGMGRSIEMYAVKR